MKLVEGRVEIFFCVVSFNLLCLAVEYVYCGIYLIAIVVQNVSNWAFDIMLETVQRWFCHENVKKWITDLLIFILWSIFCDYDRRNNWYTYIIQITWRTKSSYCMSCLIVDMRSYKVQWLIFQKDRMKKSW